MRRLHVIGASVLGSCLVFCSTTHGSDDTVSRVRARLSQGYEAAPSAGEIETLGPGAEAALLEIYRDPESTGLVKMRALDLLASFPSEDLKTLLDAESARTDLPPALQRRLLTVAIRAFGAREPAVAERVWRVNVASPDPTVRYDAAKSMEKLGSGPELRRAAQERTAVETDPAVKSELEKALMP